MIEYISRNYLLKMAMIESDYTMETQNDIDTLFRLIEDAPKANVEPVVRCEECIYREDRLCCRRLKTPFITTNLDFCSFGKRKSK